MSGATNDEVLVERRGRILVITLNRPEAGNAIDTAVAQGLLAAVDELDGDPSLTLGVVAGNGKGFCSGMDLKAFAREGAPKGLIEFMERGSRKPLIAAVEGFALAGGLEVALVCDLIVASRGAKFGIPEVKVGLFAAGGALLRLPQRLPAGVALELALTAQPITAEEAHPYGLVNRLTEPGGALAGALELAEVIAANAPLAVAASKQIMRATVERGEDEGWELQKPLTASVFRSDDAKEGPRAFAEKRPPVWSGT